MTLLPRPNDPEALQTVGVKARQCKALLHSALQSALTFGALLTPVAHIGYSSCQMLRTIEDA